MPPSFKYTGAILLNHPAQGLLHTLLRHFDEWAKVIPNLRFFQFFNTSFQNQINNIGNAKNPKAAKILLQKISHIIAGLDDTTLIDLNDTQLDIYKFIQKNVISDANYVGEGCNDIGLQQVYWKIKDIHGNDQILVICVSKELFSPNLDFQDYRPIRTITTVFTIQMKDFKNRCVTKLHK